jgi:hypothetical protein
VVVMVVGLRVVGSGIRLGRVFVPAGSAAHNENGCKKDDDVHPQECEIGLSRWIVASIVPEEVP